MLSFLKTQGTRVVNELGEDIKLIGVRLGRVLLSEKDMWSVEDIRTDKTKSEDVTNIVFGKERNEVFGEEFYNKYIVEDDIKRISTHGFNAIRIPINYRFIISEEGTLKKEVLLLIDNVIKWCDKNELYVILDFQGVLDRQASDNIDDSINDLPELLPERKLQEQTIEIWTYLATKYKDNSVIAAYGLITQALPSYSQKINDKLIEIYKELISEIRKVDNRHIIILEEDNWVNDSILFTSGFGENIMLELHKDWNSLDYNNIKRNHIEFKEKSDIKISLRGEEEIITDEYNEIMKHLCETLIEKLQWNKSDLRKRGNKEAFIEMYKRSIENHGLNSENFRSIRDKFLVELESNLKNNMVDLRDDYNINNLVTKLKNHKLNYWYLEDKDTLEVILEGRE